LEVEEQSIKWSQLKNVKGALNIEKVEQRDAQINTEEKETEFIDDPNPKRLGFVLLPTDITGPAEIHLVCRQFPNIVTQSTNFKFQMGNEQLSKENYDFALSNLSESLNLLRPTSSFC